MKRSDYLQRVLKARVYDVAVESPLELAPALSKRLRNKLLLKREDLQPVFSFKVRGAYNKMAGMPAARRRKGVIAASAGKRAQGVALAAQKLGCRALIVMPVTTPRIKIEAVKSRGAQVILHGDSYDDAYAKALELKRKRGLAFVHPYDDPEVIAGQGTIGMEILRQHAGEVDAIFVPVGGGGLISGIAAYVKQVSPRTRIIGVEPVDADEICAAIKDVFEDTRVVLEPAGALATAGAKKWVERNAARGRTLVAIASGANTNFDRLRFIAEEAELGEHREAVLAVTIPERPCSFKRVFAALPAKNNTQVHYRIADSEE